MNQLDFRAKGVKMNRILPVICVSFVTICPHLSGMDPQQAGKSTHRNDKKTTTSSKPSSSLVKPLPKTTDPVFGNLNNLDAKAMPSLKKVRKSSPATNYWLSRKMKKATQCVGKLIGNVGADYLKSEETIELYKKVKQKIIAEIQTPKDPCEDDSYLELLNNKTFAENLNKRCYDRASCMNQYIIQAIANNRLDEIEELFNINRANMTVIQEWACKLYMLQAKKRLASDPEPAKQPTDFFDDKRVELEEKNFAENYLNNIVQVNEKNLQDKNETWADSVALAERRIRKGIDFGFQTKYIHDKNERKKSDSLYKTIMCHMLIQYKANKDIPTLFTDKAFLALLEQARSRDLTIRCVVPKLLEDSSLHLLKIVKTHRYNIAPILYVIISDFVIRSCLKRKSSIPKSIPANIKKLYNIKNETQKAIITTPGPPQASTSTAAPKPAHASGPTQVYPGKSVPVATSFTTQTINVSKAKSKIKKKH